MNKENEPVTVTQAIPASAEEVWLALTDAAAMRQWYFDLEHFKPEPGFAFHFTGEVEGIKYLHHCVITEVVPFEKISYSWRYDGHKGNTLVTFLLHAQLPLTHVTVLHEGIESFGNSNPHLSKESFRAGWKYLLQTALKNYLAKTQAGSKT